MVSERVFVALLFSVKKVVPARAYVSLVSTYFEMHNTLYINLVPGSRMMERYYHSPRHFPDVVLNYLSLYIEAYLDCFLQGIF
jgi:hypothetical protein